MKNLKVKLGKTAHCAYLYADGHCVVTHQEKHAKAGEVEWAEVYEKLAVRCDFTGRIVFHEPKRDLRFALATQAHSVRATEPTLESGSENTKRHNLRVSYFEISNADGTYLSWSLIPDLLSNGICYQPDCVETFAGLKNEYFWGITRISKIHKLETESVQPLETVAA